MTQETVGYVQLEWTCKRCGSKNPGTQKTCANCGNPMSEQDQFELPSQQQLITDEDELKKARLGPDIHCKYCGARNPADAKNCKQCGADLTEGAKRAAGRVMGAFESAPVPDVKCPACGTLNPANAVKCKQCGSPMVAEKPAAQPARPATPTLSPGLIVLAVLALVACVAFFILATRTSDTTARVESVQWERAIEIVALRPVERADWADLIPAQAQVGQCSERVRHTQPEPAPNADKICGTPYTIDEGSGVGKVVQDCVYEVKDRWCSYTQPEWVVIDAVVAQGGDLQPKWPVLGLLADQREGGRSERYEVVFDADGKEYRYSIGTAEDFARFAVGSRWTLKVSGLGGVTDVQPAP